MYFIVFLFVILVVFIFFFDKEKKHLINRLTVLEKERDFLPGLDSKNTHMVDIQLGNNDISQILVVKLDHIGDMILALPALHAIRLRWPNAKITLLASPWAKDLLEPENVVDVFISTSLASLEKQSLSRWKEVRKIQSFLQKQKYDLALDMRFFDDTAYLLRFVHARFKAIFFCVESMQEPVQFRIVPPKGLHASHKISYMASQLGCPVDPLMPAIRVSGSEHVFAEKFCLDRGISQSRIVAFHPFASVKSREWALDKFVAVATKLVKDCGVVCLFFVGNDEPLLDLNRDFEISVRNSVYFVVGTTLRESAAILSGCDLFIGNNSGPMHLASAVDIPTLGVFSGVETPLEWGPLCKKHKTIITNVPCLGCHQSRCDHLTCLTSIMTEHVYRLARMLLDDHDSV